MPPKQRKTRVGLTSIVTTPAKAFGEAWAQNRFPDTWQSASVHARVVRRVGMGKFTVEFEGKQCDILSKEVEVVNSSAPTNQAVRTQQPAVYQNNHLCDDHLIEYDEDGVADTSTESLEPEGDTSDWNFPAEVTLDQRLLTCHPLRVAR